jgi:hypothetical protein
VTTRNTLVRCTALLALAGCTGLDPSAPDFGALYQVSTEPPPILSGTTLVVTLTFSGCNGGHTFQLVTRTKDLTSRIWLRKVTDNQTCDMLITEDRGFELPVGVAQSLSITLRAPNGEFTLR